jgi:small subunit ribosomal protein S20
MAHSISARKRVRQNIVARSRNRWRLRAMRESIKNFNSAVASGTVKEATEAFRAASAIVDRTAQKGPIHRNQAARRKSRMAARLKSKALGTA